MSATLAPAAPGPHWPGLILAGSGVALVLASLGDAGLLPIFGLALLLGAAFVWLDYGFAGGYRSLLVQGDGRTLGAAFIVPAVAALVVLPVGTLVEGYGRFVAPVGLPLVLGAAIFGIGMQMTNGCGSGALVAAGQGSRRMLVALPFFCLGGVLGTLLLPGMMLLPDFGIVDFSDLFGPWAGLLATECLLLLSALLVLRGARPTREKLLAGAIIGVLAAALFLASGLPWGHHHRAHPYGARSFCRRWVST